MNRKKSRSSIPLIFCLAALFFVCLQNFGKNTEAWRWGRSQLGLLKLKMNQSGLQISGTSKKKLTRIQRKLSPLEMSIKNGFEKSRIVDHELQKKKSQMSPRVYGTLFSQWERNRKLIEENRNRVADLPVLEQSSEQQRLLMELQALNSSNDSLLAKLREF